MSFLIPMINIKAVDTSAKAYIVIETTTNKIIDGKNINTRLPIASTTKIMTAICAIENTDDLNKEFVVSDEAVGIEGSSIYLKQGEKISMENLLYGLLLNSGNDASVAIAMNVSGSIEKFCNLMNETAKKIGAKNTNFTNPSGLYDENHYSSAYDLAIISSYAMKNELFRQIVSTKSKKISNTDGENERYLNNHNKLLNMYEGVNGIKTGYTKKCGRCLVSSCHKDGVDLIVVTLNAPDDWNDHKRLLDYGFSKLKHIEIASDNSYAQSCFYKDKILKLKYETHLDAIEGENNNFYIKHEIKKDIKDVSKNDKIGKAYIYDNGKIVSETNLVISDVSQNEMIKTKDENIVKKIFKKLFSLYTFWQKLYNNI